MQRRSGATLIEVLVAVFVTAIGLLALLALFPVGAVSMAKAIQNNRASQAAANAAAIANFQNLAQDSTISSSFISPSGLPAITGTGLSYPVYVDSIGKSITINGLGNCPIIPTAPPASSPGIPRQYASFATSSADIIRWLGLTDDISFQTNGIPAMSGGFVERENRYSWCYLLQRPNASFAGQVKMTVVVYSGRSWAVQGENYFNVDFQKGSTTVLVPWDSSSGQAKPEIRPGRWILDATVLAFPTTTVSSPSADPHGDFYRVVNVTEGVTYNNPVTGKTLPAVLLELQTPILKSSFIPGSPGPPVAPGPQQGVLVVMDNVIEVFQK
jgi:Prokaryotic N-terminal methylation motif